MTLYNLKGEIFNGTKQLDGDAEWQLFYTVYKIIPPTGCFTIFIAFRNSLPAKLTSQAGGDQL